MFRFLSPACARFLTVSPRTITVHIPPHPALALLAGVMLTVAGAPVSEAAEAAGAPGLSGAVSVGAGTQFADCAQCPVMVILPRGRFRMGSEAGEADRGEDEGPAHWIQIDYDLAVGKYEVTFAEWDACVAGGGCGGYRPYDQGWGRGRRPVIDVSWSDTIAYLRWLSRRSGQAYRLLSETEWEYAARANTTTPYSSGTLPSTRLANFNGSSIIEDDGAGAAREGLFRRRTLEVGSFPPNGFGLHDMQGNVWEWVEDCWEDNYNLTPHDGTPLQSRGCSYRVIRGGGWDSRPAQVRSAERNGYGIDNPNDGVGFRVARVIRNAPPEARH